MANWLDFFALTLTITFVGALIYGVIYVVQLVNAGVTSTKESLKSKGLDISSTGVSVKTSKRFGREDYVDATQRGIVKAMGAASFRKNDASSTSVSSPPSVERNPSSSSTKSLENEEKKKKKSIFGKK